MLEAFFAFVNCMINKKKTEYKNIEMLLLVFLKHRIRIEIARVRGSNKDRRDVFLADSLIRSNSISIDS